MSVRDRYRKNAAGFTARVAAVPPARWGDPSPCSEWNALDVVRHCIDASGLFLGFVGRTVPAGPAVDDDPLGAWANARDAVQAALDDPAVAQTEYEGFTGKATFEQGIDRFVAPDLVVHTWDLARATGGDERLDPDEVHRAHEAMAGFDDKLLRQPGVFGPAVAPPPGADEQAQLLAFLGRQV